MGNKIRFTNWVISSKKFFWIALSIMITTSLLIIFFYLIDTYEINGKYFNQLTGGYEETKIWLRLVFTSLGATLAVLSLLLINRHNKDFIYFSIPSALCLTLNSILSNLMFDAMKWISVGTVLCIQAILWNIKAKHEVKFKKIELLPLGIIIVSILTISLIAGIGVSYIPSTSPFYNKSPILDPIQFAFTISGNILIMFYFIESRIIYLIGNSISIFMFTLILWNGEWLVLIQIVQLSLYFVISISGYFEMKKETN